MTFASDNLYKKYFNGIRLYKIFAIIIIVRRTDRPLMNQDHQ